MLAAIVLGSHAETFAPTLISFDGIQHVPFKEYGLPQIPQNRIFFQIPEAPAALPLPEVPVQIVPCKLRERIILRVAL